MEIKEFRVLMIYFIEIYLVTRVLILVKDVINKFIIKWTCGSKFMI